MTQINNLWELIFNISVQKHSWLLFLIVSLFILASAVLIFLCYTYNRSFMKHQERVDEILCGKTPPGTYVKKVDVGHNGTSIEFAPTNESRCGP